MRRSSSLRARLVAALLPALVVASATAGCGGGVEVSLQLKPAIDETTGALFDTSALQSLNVTVASDAGKTDEIRIVLDRSRQVALSPITVDKTAPFTLDVWGCESADTCGVADVVFRGCTPEALNLVDKEGVVPVVIQMHPKDDIRLSGCPAL